MLNITYKDYLDKVFGCWLGKCVAGTIGAPFEGAKELFDFKYDPAVIENMLPNDDLDLQILWLSVLEEKGVHFTSDDLAEAFFNRCPYAPGEYAVFKKNYARGIYPPVSGAFNNRYYIEGMGCPIRSEIWGCIAPGDPELAAELAAKDGVLDHAGNSVYAEQFLAGLEAAAFFESDLDKLVDTGLDLIPEDSKTYKMITDVRNWCKASDDWRFVRSQVIQHYGHPDCTNMFQNIGITLLSLYFGKMDFLETTMIALNCGYDTDCTCATAGAILGIIQGADYLMKTHGFTDQGFVLGVDAPRRSDRVLDLAEDTCKMGVYFSRVTDSGVNISDAPQMPAIMPVTPKPVTISVDYQDIPAIGIGDTARVGIWFTNQTDDPISGTVKIEAPEGWIVSLSRVDLIIPAGDSVLLETAISVPANTHIIQDTNICTASFAIDGGEAITRHFGLAGAAVWQVFGPFWQNCTQMPEMAIKDSYYRYISGSNDQEYADNGRAYHLNACVDLGREYMTMDELMNPPAQPEDAAKVGRLVNIYEDKFSVSDLVGYQGPCAVYMVRKLICPEDRTLGIQIGHTDAYTLWINGELVSKRDNMDWWTAENAHILNFQLKKGVNTIIWKLIRRTDKADFSLIFSKGGSCSEHYVDFASVNPGI